MNLMNFLKTISISIMVCLAVISLVGCGNNVNQLTLQEQGTWIEGLKVAEADQKPHPVKVQVVQMIRDPDQVQSAIDNYNGSGKGSQIGNLSNDNLAYGLVEYRVKFPKDYPQEVFGITDVALDATILSVDGGPLTVEGTTYKGLGDTLEIGDLPQGYDFHAGDTYEGKILFAMVKDYTEFVLCLKGAGPDGQDLYFPGN